MPVPDSEYTEADLRGTLQTIADRDEPDHVAFRARLAVAAENGPAGEAAPEVIEIDRERDIRDDRDRAARLRSRVTHSRVTHSRVTRLQAFAVAACVAVVLLVAGLILGLGRHAPVPGPRDPAASVPVPRPQVPGSVVLQRYAGVGPASITVPHYRVPAHYTLATVAACRGLGQLRITPGASAPSCGSVVGDSFPASIRTLRVTVRAETAWRLILVREPLLRTNGSVQSPIDREFAHPGGDELGRGSGQGDGSVRVRRGAGGGGSGGEERITLTCHGSGVAIASVRSGYAGFYTHTCFAGAEYIFEVQGAPLPLTLQVAASPDTTWQLFVTYD